MSSSSLFITAGIYGVEIAPAAQVSGFIQEIGDGPYELTLAYYNEELLFTTRPTVDNGGIGQQPRFS
jgi:succinylglutamate desuccinylase